MCHYNVSLMKKFFIYLFNGFCWFFDSVLFVVETIVKSIWTLFNFFFTSLIYSGRQLRRLINVKNWNKPKVRTSVEESYTMRVIRISFLIAVQIVVSACILQALPPGVVRPIGLFFRTPWVYLLALIAGLFLLLPQQQLFRDPVTRIFFRRGWFKNYGEASFFTKSLSFFIIFILFCNACVK